jgi:hypothetical protein
LGPQKIQEVQSYASQPPLLILEKLGLGLGAAPDTATQFVFQFVMSFALLRACLMYVLRAKKISAPTSGSSIELLRLSSKRCFTLGFCNLVVLQSFGED